MLFFNALFLAHFVLIEIIKKYKTKAVAQNIDINDSMQVEKLVEFVLNSNDSKLFTVETGLDNEPATTLYKKFNFKEVKQWDTDHGIRKIRFERKIDKR